MNRLANVSSLVSLLSLSAAACGPLGGDAPPPRPKPTEVPCRYEKPADYFLYDSRYAQLDGHLDALQAIDCKDDPGYHLVATVGSLPPGGAAQQQVAGTWWIEHQPNADRIQSTWFYDHTGTLTGVLVLNNNFGATCPVILYGQPVWPWKGSTPSQWLCRP